MIPKPVASAIIVLVTIIWAANFVAPIVLPEYKPDVTINGIFMGIVGAAFAFGRKGTEKEAAPPPAPAPVSVGAPDYARAPEPERPEVPPMVARGVEVAEQFGDWYAPQGRRPPAQRPVYRQQPPQPEQGRHRHRNQR